MKQIPPLARRDSLIVKELPDETLVYDRETDQAHCLNLTAARIWKNCDGQRTVRQLAELMGRELGSEVPEEMIWVALNQLEKFNLLQIIPAQPAVLAQMDRRQWARSIGIAALLLPVVLTITVPTAMAQASSCNNRPCVSPGDCCPANPSCGPSKKCH